MNENERIVATRDWVLENIGQSDWNVNDENDPAYVKNRTHYETETNRIIEWDGNTAGLIHCDNMFYKVSDYIPTDEEILGGTFTIWDYLGQFGMAPILVERTIEYNDFVDSFETFRAVLLMDQIYGIVVAKQDNISGPHDRIFPEKGIYFLSLGGGPASLTLNSKEVKQLDEKFIPSTIARNEDVLLKTEQVLTDTELAQVRSNLKFIGKDVEGQTFNINGTDIVASANAEIFGDYENNKCTGQWSIVEGSANVATGRACHVEGAQNQALSDGCHVEGVNCIASGYWSHAEGEMTRVTSYASHAEGSYTKMPDGTTRYGTASGYASHIEGGGCHAESSCSHSEGLATTAKGNYAHSEGKYTIASSPAQHVQGAGNIEDANSVYLHIVGNGDFGSPSNAHTLDWQGNARFAGDLYVNGTGADNLVDAKKVATEEFVANVMEAITFDRIDEICGIEPIMTLMVDEDGDAVINAGFPDDAGNLTI